MDRNFINKLGKTALFSFISAQIWVLIVVIIVMRFIYKLHITVADILFIDAAYTTTLVLIQVSVEALIHRLFN